MKAEPPPRSRVEISAAPDLLSLTTAGVHGFCGGYDFGGA